MKNVIYSLAIASIPLALMGNASDAFADERPNIIPLLADDLGYGDLSCFGSPAVETPYLDRLASEGMKFKRFYAGSAVCSPTRASVLTGRYPLRFGITKHFNDVNRWLPESATTVAELLKNAGYNTAHVGKWHLGGLHVDENGKRLTDQPGPRQHGFDFYQTQIEQQPLRGRMGRERTLFRQGGTVLLRNDKRVGDDDSRYPKHFTDANGDFAVEMIERFSAEEKPFFINVWWLVPHKPYEPAPEAPPSDEARGTVFWQLDLYRNLQRHYPKPQPYATEVAMRGKWKLLALGGKPVELFDVEADPYEKRNIMTDHPDLVASLSAELTEWLSTPRTTE